MARAAQTFWGDGYLMLQARSYGTEALYPSTVFVDTKPPTPPPQETPLPGEDDEAFISWGEESRFDSQQISSPSSVTAWGGGFNTKTDNPKDKEPKKDVEKIYSEQYRVTEEVRVENPDDENQYVMVERISEIGFNAPDGSTVIFQLTNR